MAERTGRPAASTVLSLFAAFLWATYYVFVLILAPTTGDDAVIAWPFLFAGFGFLVLTVWEGNGRTFLQLWKEPAAYLRAALLFGMQLTVLLSAYTAGPVDTSLLSLVGDVVLTPMLLMLFAMETSRRARSPLFWSGVLLATGGSALTILGGQSAPPLHGVAWAIAPSVVVTVAAYFLLTARANRRWPSSAVLAQNQIAGGLLALALAPAFPGGIASAGIPSLESLALLVGLGVTSFLVAQWAYFLAIQYSGLLLPALLMSAIPVFTLFVAFVAFGLAPAWLGLLGIPVAVVGSILSLRGDHAPWGPVARDAAAPAR